MAAGENPPDQSCCFTGSLQAGVLDVHVKLLLLTCAHFLLTALDVVIFHLQLLHAGAGDSWNVGKVGGRGFGTGGIAAFHQKLPVINNPGTWGDSIPSFLNSLTAQNTQGLGI